MTAVGIPANAKQLAALVKEGEGPALEFKRSTGELKEGMQTLCAFLNGSGGVVLFGARPEGAIEGRAVSDQTLRDVAHAADRFEPPAHVAIHRIKVKAGREVVAAVVAEPVPAGAKNPGQVKVLLGDLKSLSDSLTNPGQQDGGELTAILCGIHPIVEKLLEAAGMPHVHEDEKPAKKAKP